MIPKKHLQAASLVCIAFLFSISLIAQTQVQKEKRQTFFRIKRLTTITADSLIAIIEGGSKQGIELGQTGPIKGVYKSSSDRSALELGFGSVRSVADTFSVISIRPKNTSDKRLAVLEGDYVKLSVNIPKLGYHSIFFDLALLNIDFRNNSKQPLYSFDDLLFSDSKKLEDSLLQSSAADVIETYKWFIEDTSFNSLAIPLTKGRYINKSAFEVMRNCTRRDIYTFLSFVKGYPGKYIGNSWKINETFVTWVINGAPYSEGEILDSIIAYQSKPASLKRFILANRELLVKDEYVRAWISSAIDLENLGERGKAEKQFETVKTILVYLDDDCSNGFFNYAWAQLCQNSLKYAEAIRLCDTAIVSFKRCGNKRFYIESLFKKAFCLRELKKQDEALLVYAEIDKAFDATDMKYTDEDMVEAVGKFCRETGYTYREKSDYKKAIDRFSKAIQLYKAQNTFESLNNASDLLLAIASIYKDQGEFSKALEIYHEQLANCRYLGDKKKEGTVLDNIGYIQSKLGNYKDAISRHQQAKELHIWVADFTNAGYAQSQIGQALWNLGNYDSAIVAHNTAISYRRQAVDASGQAYSWKKLASLYNLVGQKEKALASYDSTAKYYTLAKDSTSLIENLLDVGEVYNTDKQYQKAFEYFTRAHALNIKRNNKASTIDSYFKMASAAYQFDTAVSRKYYTASYQLAKDIGDKSNALYSALNLGLLANRAFQFELAEKYFNEGLQLSVEEKSKSNEAYAYAQIGNALLERFEFDKAITAFKKADRIYDSIDDRSHLPGIYSSIGYALSGSGDFKGSISYFEKSKATAYNIKNIANVAEALNSLSYVYALQGEKDKALAASDSALTIFKSINNSYQVGNSYITLGNVYNLRDEYQKAIEYYQKADSMFIIEKSDLSRSVAKNNIGDVYFLQSDYEKALVYFLESEKIYARVNLINESMLITMANLGETYYRKKDFTRALKYMTDVYKRSKEKGVARSMSSAGLVLGQIAFDQNKQPEAEKYLQDARDLSLKINIPNNVIQSYLFLGKLYDKQDNISKSIHAYQTAIDYSRTTGSTRYSWELLYEMGMAYYKINKFDSAASLMKDAVVLIENRSENLFGGNDAKKIFSADFKKVDLYNKLVASLIKTNKGNEAMYYADKSNSQGVKEMLKQSGIATTDPVKSAGLEKANDLIKTASNIEKNILKEISKPEQLQNKVLIDSLKKYKEVAEKDYTNYINTLVKSYPDLQVYFAKTNPIDFKNYMEFIPDSTVVALYVINDNVLYIFTATSKKTSIKVVELKRDINADASKFLALLKNPASKTGTGALTTRSTIKAPEAVAGDYKKEAANLYDVLIAPIADELKDVKNLCIIPNGKLSNIPFQALGKMRDDKFHFVVEDYRIFYTNKLDIFTKPHKQQRMENSFVALGNPDKSLPKATNEVNNLIKIISTGRSYIEDAATEDIAKSSLKDFRYIHLATHGVLDYGDFEKSFLMFGVNKKYLDEDGKAEDGKLTIQEINGLSIKDCDLVTLSACETAVSQETVKGWYISPANSFLANRVKSVVASLWQVDDEATSILMDEFYKNLQVMSKSEALRNAQQTLSRNPKYTHPYFWSAFVLYGEWR
ncbi:MAG TPA: tetratricopeptide repeat protein [Segetibacter sp.]|jgi:CHAT domain-containing protein